MRQAAIQHAQQMGEAPEPDLMAEAEPAHAPIVKTAEEKLGRNDPCYCGSGKKYKHCHGA
jgi:preprotein translocase subunit SecA